MKALIVVDVQRDFCPGGALGVPDGDAVVGVLNSYMDLFAALKLPIYLTRDWHPEVTVHFKDSGGLWPTHCVAGTTGADFHADLNSPEGAVIVSKGRGAEDDVYSAFEGSDEGGTGLRELLKGTGVAELYVGGLATDYCVRATALDALSEGFKVTVLTDAIRGVDRNPGDSERAMEEMKKAGAATATLESIKV